MQDVRIALKKRLQDKDIEQELVLDSDCVSHTSEDKTFLLYKVTMTVKGKIGQCTCNTQVYRGSEWVETK
jgi:hypothetical protein